MNNIKPIFFYNLGEYINQYERKNNDWFKKVSFTIADFIGQSMDSKIAVVIFKEKNQKIKQYHLDYEYFYEGILSIHKDIEIDDNIFLADNNNIENIETTNDGFMINANIEGLDEFLDYFINKFEGLDKYYLHITPYDNLESILENGFYAGNPTGDKTDSNHETQYSNHETQYSNSQYSNSQYNNSIGYVDDLNTNNISLSNNNGLIGIAKFREKTKKVKKTPTKVKKTPKKVKR
tara:strand:+ start:894 stop:1598 length:705 start_codon:yes stop_codon:yes gene_type:complete